jgi:two-component system sensor histidine kinase KdpD
MDRLVRGVLGLSSQMLLYLLAVVAVALVPALAAAVAAAVLLDHYFVSPTSRPRCAA